MGDCDEFDMSVLASMFDDEQFDNCDKTQQEDSKSKEKTSQDLEEELRNMAERMAAVQEELRRKKAEENSAPVKAAPKLFDVGLSILAAETDNKITNESRTNRAIGSAIHAGDTDSSDEEERRDPMTQKYNEFGKFVRKRIAHEGAQTNREPQRTTKLIGNQLKDDRKYRANGTSSEEKNVAVDPFSGIRIMNPLVSSTEMRDRMASRKMIQLSSIRFHVRGGDIEGDWVTIGVIANKMEPKKSSKGNLYSIWKLCDLKDCDKVVSLFLFGKNHEQHWKTSVGSVVGVLNATLMPNKETNNKANELCLTIDHPQKIMLMGVAKDFGHCKGRRKDGAACTMFINKSDCEFCPFHIQKEYRKSCSKRSDLQSSYSGAEPNCFRAKILQKQQIMYGGQLYVNPRPEKKGPKNRKDKLILGNLKLQRKASELAKVERTAINAEHLSKQENKFLNHIGDQCDAFGKMLCVPTSGSRNLLTHLKMNDGDATTSSSASRLKSITPNELLKLHAKDMESKRTMGQFASAKNKTLTAGLSGAKGTDDAPKLGKGFRPGQVVLLDFDASKRDSFMAGAKLIAIQKVKTNLRLPKANPNNIKAARTTTDFQEKVKKRLAFDACEAEPNEKKQCKEEKPLDGSSEKFLAILNRKSKYDNLLEQENAVREEKYFNEMERKEKIETKMCSTMEVQCKAYSCKKCNYTAFSALETCRTSGHPIVSHNATKRYFKCNDCSRRTVSLSRLPTKPCSGCGNTNYERVAMCKEKRGPTLENEQLCIRGAEQKFINSHSATSLNF